MSKHWTGIVLLFLFSRQILYNNILPVMKGYSLVWVLPRMLVISPDIDRLYLGLYSNSSRGNPGFPLNLPALLHTCSPLSAKKETHHLTRVLPWRRLIGMPWYILPLICSQIHLKVSNRPPVYQFNQLTGSEAHHLTGFPSSYGPLTLTRESFWLSLEKKV